MAIETASSYRLAGTITHCHSFDSLRLSLDRFPMARPVRHATELSQIWNRYPDPANLHDTLGPARIYAMTMPKTSISNGAGRNGTQDPGRTRETKIAFQKHQSHPLSKLPFMLLTG